MTRESRSIMLTPIPGTTNLLAVTPETPNPVEKTPPPAQTVDLNQQRLALRLCLVALEAAFGMRPLTHLDRRRFAAPVRIGVTSHLDTHRQRGPVRLKTLKVKHGTEIFGTVLHQGAPYAFVGKLSSYGPDRLLTFRLLDTPA